MTSADETAIVVDRAVAISRSLCWEHSFDRTWIVVVPFTGRRRGWWSLWVRS